MARSFQPVSRRDQRSREADLRVDALAPVADFRDAVFLEPDLAEAPVAGSAALLALAAETLAPFASTPPFLDALLGLAGSWPALADRFRAAPAGASEDSEAALPFDLPVDGESDL